MKMLKFIKDFPFFILTVFLIALLAAWLFKAKIDSLWTIVKQRTNETYHLDNFGFRGPSGTVVAGFQTKEQAIREMMRSRYPNKDTAYSDEWEVVK